jgi:hypothetical protein
MRGVFITLSTQEQTNELRSGTMKYLRSFIQAGDTLYAKLVYRTSSNLPGATRGYALMAICRETGKIANITHDVALVTGTRFYSDEPQCMMVRGEDVKSVVKTLSFLLFNEDNSKLNCDIWC